MKLKLNIDDYLADQLKAIADRQKQSLSEVAVDILQQAAKSGNLEQRQFIGKVISGKEIIKHEDLVSISGIYYRYRIVDDQLVNKNLNYEIINSDGNLIILKPKRGEL